MAERVPGDGGLLFTGLRWERDRPVLTGVAGGREHARALEIGQAVGWEVAGPRRCVGLYDRRERRRRPCPDGALVAGASQCDLCQQADPGRLVARGVAPSGMEREPFLLYLAWFGDELRKVGITSERRGVGRLCEQGALSFCLVARGPFTAIRQAEVLLSGTGVAPERIALPAKQAAWWRIPPVDERAAELCVMQRVAAAAIRAVPGVEPLEFQATDLTPLYGLDRGMPGRYDLATAVRPGSVLAGDVSHVIGSALVLGASRLAVDCRLLEGWTLRRSSGPAREFDAETWSREADARAVQGTLF